MGNVTLHLRVIDSDERYDRRLTGVVDVPLAEALTSEVALTLTDGRQFTVLVREERPAPSIRDDAPELRR